MRLTINGINYNKSLSRPFVVLSPTDTYLYIIHHVARYFIVSATS